MATQAKRDYYEILSVTRTATEQEIKSAYRRLAMQYHPDRNPGDSQAEEKFKECTEAYSVLMDAEKRARYDQYGHAAVNGGGFGGFDPSNFGNINDFLNSVLNDFLGVNIGRGQNRRPQTGEDVEANLTLTFEEAAFGCKKQVSVRRYEPCAECKGTGSRAKGAVQCSTCRGQGQVEFQRGFLRMAQPCPACQGNGTVIPDPCHSCRGEGRVIRERTKEVAVPAGIDASISINHKGEGNPGYNGGRPGNLYVTFQVKPHPFFEREGKDLHCAVPISFSQAAVGAEIIIPTLDGGEHKLKVPEGTQSGTTFRVRGKGVPALQSSGKGDMYVKVRVHTPHKLTKRQRELLAELGDSIENTPEPRSLFEKVKDIFG